MRSELLFCVLALAAAGNANAKDPMPYQTGKLLQMDSVKCGVDAKNSNSGDTRTQELLCQEYVLQADSVNYRIRPRDEKHPVLLPVGNRAQFRIRKDKMVLRTEDFSGKEREYRVVSITPRSEASSADSSTIQLNHLQ
jgi:hypothetical protein